MLILPTLFNFCQIGRHLEYVSLRNASDDGLVLLILQNRILSKCSYSTIAYHDEVRVDTVIMLPLCIGGKFN